MERDTEPTEDEEKNGWSKAGLNAYIRERDLAAVERIFGERKQPLVVKNVKRFNPHKW